MRLLGDWRYENEGQDEEPAPWMTKAEFDEWLSRKPEDLREAYRYVGPAPDTWYGSMVPLKVELDEGGKRRLRPAIPQAVRASLLGLLDLAAATKTGELTSEALDFLTMIPMGAGALLAPRGALAMGGSRRAPPRDVQPPSLRGRPADEAIRVAREEPHLIESGKGPEGSMPTAHPR